MNLLSYRSKLADKRTQWCVISSLLLVLLAIIFWPADEQSTSESFAPISLINTKLPTPEASQLRPRSVWPAASLDDAMALNIFQPLPGKPKQTLPVEPTTPQPSDAPQQSQSQTTLHTLAAGQLQAIYHNGSETVAMVDSHIVRVGDSLADGGRIVQITQREVLVARD